MAIKRTLKLNNGLGEFIEHFICDEVTDLDDLPGLEDGTISGSTVLCLENKKKYMLSVAGEWKEAPPEGGISEEEWATKADLVDGVVPAEQLPSYVDDVLEFTSLDAFPIEGEKGKIYVALDTNKTYRWSGSTYIPLTPDEIDGNLTKLQVKRGLEDELPTLDVGEPGFTTDSKKLFIGSADGNVEIGAGGGGSVTAPVIRMDEVTNTLDLSLFGIPFPVYQLDIDPNKKYVIESQPENTPGLDAVYILFTPTDLDYTDSESGIIYNDTELKEFTVDIYFEKDAIVNFIDIMTQTMFYKRVDSNIDYDVNSAFFYSIELPGETLYTFSMVDGNLLIYAWPNMGY